LFGSSSIWTESLTVVLAVGVGAGVDLGVVTVAAFDVADGASGDVPRSEPWPQDARSRRRNGSRM
jgi:hypothetical protein